MPCVRDPPCGCCKAHRPCAYELQLDAAQWAQIKRMERIVGHAKDVGLTNALHERLAIVETADEWLERISRPEKHE
jgi:hypothetical protein